MQRAAPAQTAVWVFNTACCWALVQTQQMGLHKGLHQVGCAANHLKEAMGTQQGAQRWWMYATCRKRHQPAGKGELEARQ